MRPFRLFLSQALSPIFLFLVTIVVFVVCVSVVEHSNVLKPPTSIFGFDRDWGLEAGSTMGCRFECNVYYWRLTIVFHIFMLMYYLFISILMGVNSVNYLTCGHFSLKVDDLGQLVHLLQMKLLNHPPWSYVWHDGCLVQPKMLVFFHWFQFKVNVQNQVWFSPSAWKNTWKLSVAVIDECCNDRWALEIHIVMYRWIYKHQCRYLVSLIVLDQVWFSQSA